MWVESLLILHWCKQGETSVYVCVRVCVCVSVCVFFVQSATLWQKGIIH